jgi:hypothetical protein
MEPPRKRNQIEPRQLPRHDDERIALARELLRLHDAISIPLGILEAQRILGLDLGRNFLGRARIQELHQTLASIDAHVMTAFRADMQTAFNLGLVEHRVARRTFGPQAFGNRARTTLGFDAGGDNSLEPGHTVVYQNLPDGAGMP